MSLTWRIPVTFKREAWNKRDALPVAAGSVLCHPGCPRPARSPCTSAGEPMLTGSALRLPAPAAALLQTGTSAASLSSSFPKANSCTVLTGTTRLLLASNTILSSKTPIFPARSARSCLRSTLLWGFRGRAEAGAAGSSRSTRGWARRLAEPPLASRSHPGCFAEVCSCYRDGLCWCLNICSEKLGGWEEVVLESHILHRFPFQGVSVF